MNPMMVLLKSAISVLLLASSSLVSAQTLQTLCSFNGSNGANPYGGLTLGNDGNFYATTEAGGSSGYGTVFKITTGGTLTTLVSFSGTNGSCPCAALTLGNDGNFYGTTLCGGSGYDGTVFKVTTDGTLTTLHSFTQGHNVTCPWAGLTLGNDGNLYGTTFGGGITNSTYVNGMDGMGHVFSMGTVFRVTTAGTLTTLVSFNSTNGANPAAALTLGNDGNFYGTTVYRGSGAYGTVFKMTTAGTLTTLVAFNYNNGAYPQAALTVGNDGNFYGTADTGGSANWGTMFQITTNGALTTMVAFNSTHGYPNALKLANDGYFYGTTQEGGSSGYGTVFRVTTAGSLTTLASFGLTNGAYPYAGLTLGNDGNFYGTTSAVSPGGGHTPGMGTVFRLLLPPVITVQPQSQTNNAGATAIFHVVVASPNPLSYQWQKNGTNLVDGGSLSGATIDTLTITSISDSDAAIYSVIVSNSNGSLTSSTATLTVTDPPVITAQPTNLLVLVDTKVAFGVSLAGSAPFFRYQWRLNGTDLLNATNAIYSIPSVGTNNAGNYFVVVTNAAGTATSSNAALTVVLSPRSQTNYSGSTATLTAAAFSSESLNYQWQKNSINLVEGARLSGTTNSTLTIASVSDADAGRYSALVSDASGSVTTSNAVLTVSDLPFIASQPRSQTVVTGSVVTFTITAYGAPPLVFQWYFKGAPVGSPTTGTDVSSYALSSVGTNQAGNYSVEVFNGYGSVTSSNATLTVVVPAIITTQPMNRTNNAGTTATFSVAAANASPLSYQWQKNSTNLVNGAKLNGATNSTLTITSVSDNDAGIYSVTVTNLAGSVTSSNATLTVIDPPVITAQPLGQRIMLGNSVSFNVSVSGTPPFHYQWRFNGTNLLNITNAAYAIQAVGATNTGNYSVVVTNLAGSVTSSNALLTVIVPPTLALQLLPGYPLLNLEGMLSSNFVVQYSTNLGGSNWMNLLSLTNLPSSPYLFLDPAADGEPARFYRAFMR
jgi:uncharacterized repeat protein (TIGR03803 family)